MNTWTKEHEEISKGIGGLSWILFFVFLILKLTGTIYWSWWWVTCPLWILPVAGLALIAIGFVLAFIAAVFLAIFGD